MKTRSRAFDCAIAGKSVGIALRHGGGLQEPGKVYVRCDERDCQYVDLNVAPCPLRAEMFSDGSDGRVADHLAMHAGEHICYACLTDTLGITHDQVRRATWRLKEEIGLIIRPSRCGSCRRRRVTIGLPAGVAPRQPTAPPMPVLDGHAGSSISETETLADHLRARQGFFFCAHCLARDVQLPVGRIREAMWALEPDPTFPVRTAQCVGCLTVKRVIRHEEPSDDLGEARRLVQFVMQHSGVGHCPTGLAFASDLPLASVRRTLLLLEGVVGIERKEGTCAVCGRWQTVVVSTGQADLPETRESPNGDVISGLVRYRGHRIDLLSFRVNGGWRPLALIKTALGARCPDAPTVMLTLMSTKLEADQIAAREARAWIDKQSP